MNVTTEPTRLLVYGAGGMGRETAWLAESSVAPRAVDAFIVDGADVHESYRGIPFLSLEGAVDRFPHADFIVAIGNPVLRSRLVERALDHGLRPTTLVHTSAHVAPSASISPGTIVCAGSIVSTDVRIGSYVQINTACTVAHDSMLDEFVTLAPGVRLSGFVQVGRGAYLGSGAVVINGTPGNPLTLGERCVVGAGAVVVRNVPPGATVVGVPARERR